MEKTVYLLVGVSGAGKTTRARQLQAEHPDSILCSADDYMTDEHGDYCFRLSKLLTSHGSCQEKFLEAVRGGAETVIVDNHNLTVEHREFYVTHAMLYGYRVIYEVITVDPAVAAARNVHGTSLASIMQMVRKLDMAGGRYEFARIS